MTGDIFPTETEIHAARQFVLEMFRARARENGYEEPADLSRGCKFASVFALGAFGGELRGNWMHQFVVLAGRTLDLTAGDGLDECENDRQRLLRLGVGEKEVGWVSDPFEHDDRWWLNADHVASLNSVLPRVREALAAWQRAGHVIRGSLPERFTRSRTVERRDALDQ